MDFEEVESIYKQELESAEKEFLLGVQNKGDVKILEKNYKNKLKLAREKYYKVMSGIIKEKPLLKKKSKDKKEKSKVFNVKPGNYSLGFFQRLRFKTRLLSFKFWFATRNFVRRKTPDVISYNYLKLKIKTKRIFSKLRDLFMEFVKNVVEWFKKLFVKIKGLIKTGYKKSMELPGKLIDRFSRKKAGGGGEKKVGSGEEKKDEEKKEVAGEGVDKKTNSNQSK